MNLVMKIGFGVALSFMMLVSAAQADEFKLSNNQRISCSRGLAAGKLNTATCKSYAYVFNVKTSEYFRCQVSLALTRDNKEVINVQTDGSCTKKPRIFDGDSSYSFDATETEPPNTNSFFGPGGYAVWASDNNALKSARLHHRSHPASAPTSRNASTCRSSEARTTAHGFCSEEDASSGRERENFLIPIGLPNR